MNATSLSDVSRSPRWRLDGRVALVTGGGQGVGRGIARALANAGADIAIVDLDLARAKRTADEIAALGRRAFAAQADVADEAAIRDAVDKSVLALGRLDVVVNNAHTVLPGRVLDITERELDVVWSTGFLGTFNTMHAARPHLGAGASIINIVSSVMLKPDTSGFAMYAATKTAIRSLTRTVAFEWGASGIRVNALSPQTTSPAWEVWAEENAAAAAVILTEIPLAYVGEAEADVGPVAVFLASDASAYMTGGLLLADGGRGHLR